MDINVIIDKLNSELQKLNNIKKQSIDTNSFFTDNEHFNDDFSLNDENEDSSLDKNLTNDDTTKIPQPEDIEPDTETLSLVVLKERSLLTAQNMFKKSIKISLKSFLISITLSFLNLFI